jgi:folate-binding protein YgfZ
VNSTPLSDSLRQDYRALTAEAGWCDLGFRTQIEVTGADRTRLLHNLCTADVNRLQPGQGCEAFFTTVQGKTLSFAQVFCGPDSLIVETVFGQAERLMAHLDRYLIREDAQLHDRSETCSVLLVSGHQAPDRLADLRLAMPASPLAHESARVGVAPVSLRRIRMTSAHCFMLSVHAEHVQTVVDALNGAGVAACQPEALEVARVEAGWPVFGKDVTDENLPQEVDRNDLAISFSKGCYLGQETVARIDALGHVNRKLVGVRLSGDRPVEPGTPLTSEGKQVGSVTSSVYSPRLGCPLALAYVRRGYNEDSTPLQSPVGQAQVVALPV